MEGRDGSSIPASIPSGDNSVWADASPLIAAACNDLRDGELIHGENFNLFAAMSALEEEDIFVMAHGLPLQGDRDEKCLSLVNSVEETISRQLRACKAQASRKKPSDDVGSLQTNPDLEEGFCRALLCRLRFRKHFYHALMCMRKHQGRGIELAKKHVASCLSELAFMSKSVEFLRSNGAGCCHGEIECRTTASGKQPFGFDASLNNRLSAPAPPRAIQILSWKQAILHFEKLMNDLDAALSLPLDPLLENILQFLVQFQKSEPHLVARAHLQLLLIQDGKLYGRDSFHEVISRAIALPEVTRDQAFQENEFVVQLGQLVMNLIKILCTNNAWQRRKLGKILEDWGVVSIQLELAFRREYDEMLKVSAEENLYMKMSKHLLVWADEMTYWIASRFLLLGFQLELYTPKEYCMVYWYLYVIFVNLLEKMQLRITYSVDNLRRKGKKKHDLGKDAGFHSPTGVSSMCLLLQCYVYISEGLTMMLAALHNERRSFRISSPFNTEHERFIQHFELLQRANVPQHISYHLFKESTSNVQISNVLKHNYFREVQRIIASLRGSFARDPERLLELHRLEQVVEHNRVALSVIEQVGANDASLEISFEFPYHPYFAVAVVKRS